MKRFARRLTTWPLSPILMGVYPIFYLYSQNLGSVQAGVIVTPLWIAFTVGLFLTAIVWLWVRDAARTGLIVTCLYTATYVYTSAVDTFIPWIYGDNLGKVMSIAALLCVFELARRFRTFLRKINKIEPWVRIANIYCLLLLLVPLLQITWFHLMQTPATVSTAEMPRRPVPMETPPSVYYIILDGYTSSRVLRNDMGYDNSRFIRFLRARGFYVAFGSHSNYAYTYLSLASSMNMRYLNELNDVPDQQEACIHMIHTSSVFRMFRENGYRIIHLTPFWTNRETAPYTESTFSPHMINEFENLVLKRFLLRSFVKQGITNMYKTRTLHNIQRLTVLPKELKKRPAFVFAHILCPHPPFVFDRQGNTPEPQLYPSRPLGSRDWYPKERYVDQLHYLNNLVEEMIDHILKTSPQPPIIILQGDHGSASDGTSATPSPLMVRERMGILNAYLGPPEMIAELNQTISPVNTFRLVGKHLFNINFSRLPDTNYYSGPINETPYHFVDVTAQLAK